MSKLGKRYVNSICKSTGRPGATKTSDMAYREFLSLKSKAIIKKNELLKAIEDINKFEIFCDEKLKNLQSSVNWDKGTEGKTVKLKISDSNIIEIEEEFYLKS